AADAERAAAHERAVAAGAAAAATRARLEELNARLAEEEARGIARAARRIGGRRGGAGPGAPPPLRAPPPARPPRASPAYIAAAADVPGLTRERGGLIVGERAAVAAGTDDARERRFRDAVSAAGGGILDGAIRRDSAGAARRILARSAWLPDLGACLALQG